MKQTSAGRIVRWLGFAITAAALALVIWSIYTSELLSSDAWMTTEVLAGVAAATLIFCASLFCVFAAWHLLIMSVSKIHISWVDGFFIYSVSALYRYIPSNVMHYVGRYYMLRQRGVEHAVATWGILAETVLFVSSSCLIAVVFGAPLVLEELARIDTFNWSIFLLLALAAIAVVGIIAVILRRRQRSVRELIAPFLRAQVLHAGIEAFVLQLVARLLSGVALWWLSVQILGPDQVSLMDIIAIWAAAWTLGYVTPGASAGLGVREAAIITALVAIGVPAASATLTAIAFRVATTMGDLLFATGGWISHWFCGPPTASFRNT